MTTQKQFFRPFPKQGFPLYWILLAYLVIGYFYPVIGFLAIICMLAKYSPHRPIPAFVRTKGFRIFMVMFIFTMFGIQMYRAWGDWNAMGRVFWIIITVTTIVGIILSFIYAPRTWCSFCPMGSLSSWVTPRRGKLPEGYRRIFVGDRCTTRCKLCSAVCPMQLKPYESKNDTDGYLHPDCIKCGRCTAGCPLKVPEMKSGAI